MTFISHAQNYEDVMLFRALRSVGKGFYIDVGAQDPKEHSVTKAFYDRGWRGINIEPSSVWFQKLEQERPHDINLQAAASDDEGQLRFYNIPDTGLSTTSAEYAERHAKAGFTVTEQDVQSTTLDAICERNSVGVVHFLKMDCEGAEEAALRGISLAVVRPWIILVESTEPLSRKPAYESWESLLTGRQYHFVYDDGLNRFYVADEVAHLDEAFRHPPNVFDDFLRAAEYELRIEHASQQAQVHWQQMAEYLRKENDRRESALVELRGSLERHAAERQDLSGKIEYLHNENDRRESALVELRGSLERHAAERQDLSGMIEHLRNENERRENALIEARRLQSELETRNRELLATRERQLEASTKRVGEIDSLNEEVGRLHREVAHRDTEIQRLSEWIYEIHASTSWRITWPFRALKRAFNGGVSMVFASGRAIAVGLARLARPMLWKAARLNWLRRTMITILGSDSRLVERTRRFLWSVPAALPASAVQVRDAVSELDWQSMRVYQHILPNVERDEAADSEAKGAGTCT